MTYTVADFAAETDVSRETLAEFEAWHDLLTKWNRRINLVSPKAMSGFWQRHALDSWQVTAHLPEGDIESVDLGSGAGFPGLAVGIALKARGEGRAHVVESAGKKANFLRTVVRDLDLPVTVHNQRVENLDLPPMRTITARAFAPTERLLDYALPFWGPDTVGIFPKGQGAEAELEISRETFDFEAQTFPSRSDSSGVIVLVRKLKARDSGA